ncbi:hypothetical protein GCM10023335_64010 [Streptomyces siamensis]|uniref:Uncharacterized protein n=1 Tax=Streptomyces siamensis TaxID=1274986 RepID=A0ABP9JET5_9ACTN
MVLSGPPLDDTDTGTNEARGGPVTRRTGETECVRAYAVYGVQKRSRRGQMRPRHSSSSVIAREVPGLPSASL